MSLLDLGSVVTPEPTTGWLQDTAATPPPPSFFGHPQVFVQATETLRSSALGRTGASRQPPSDAGGPQRLGMVVGGNGGAGAGAAHARGGGPVSRRVEVETGRADEFGLSGIFPVRMLFCFLFVF